MTDTSSTALPRTLSPSLFLFTIIYGGMVVLAGVLGNKQVALGGWLGGQASGFLIAKYLPAAGPREPVKVWLAYAALGLVCAGLMALYRRAYRGATPATGAT